MLRVLFTACLLSHFFFESGAQARVKVAQVVNVSGTVLLRDSHGAPSRKLKANDLIYQGDILNSDSKGRAKLLFTDRTLVDIAPSTLFRIDEYQGKGEKRKVDLAMRFGKARVSVNKPVKNPGKFKFRTKSATMGVRGTVFMIDQPPFVGVTEGRSTPPRIAVFEGNVEIQTTPSTDDGAATGEPQTISLAAGQAVDLGAPTSDPSGPGGSGRQVASNNSSGSQTDNQQSSQSDNRAESGDSGGSQEGSGRASSSESEQTNESASESDQASEDSGTETASTGEGSESGQGEDAESSGEVATSDGDGPPASSDEGGSAEGTDIAANPDGGASDSGGAPPPQQGEGNSVFAEMSQDEAAVSQDDTFSASVEIEIADSGGDSGDGGPGGEGPAGSDDGGPVGALDAVFAAVEEEGSLVAVAEDGIDIPPPPGAFGEEGAEAPDNTEDNQADEDANVTITIDL